MTSNLKLGTAIINDNKLYLGSTKINKIYLGDGNVVYQTEWPKWIQITSYRNNQIIVDNTDFYSYNKFNYIGELKYNGTYYPIYQLSNDSEFYVLLLDDVNSINFNCSDIYSDVFNNDEQAFAYALYHNDEEVEGVKVNTIYLTDDNKKAYTNTTHHDIDIIIQSGN